MSKCIALLLLCLTLSLSLNSCPGYNSMDLLQSGKNAIMRGRIGGNPEYLYEAPINFAIPASGLEIAVTTGTIGDYNPIPQYGYNYFIEAKRKQGSNSITYKLIMNNDESWTSVQLSYLACGRPDLAVGNFEVPINEWTPYGSNVYNVGTKIAKNLPKANYKVAAFISGFSTTDSQFTLTVSKKAYDEAQKRLSVGFYCSANPTVLTISISYIIFPEYHPVLDMQYVLTPQGESGSYQISGPVNFQPNKRIEYNEWRVQNRALACQGNECSNICMWREECAQKDGNIYQDRCIFCAPGIIHEFGKCARRCGANQVYTNRVCICAAGFTRKGKDCVSGKVCGTNEEYSEAQRQCVCKKGFAAIGKECRECPAGSVSNGNTCACSSSNTYYDEKTNTCKNRCIENQQWVNGKCQCPSGWSWWNQKCRQCPANCDTEADQSTCICRSKTAYFNPETNSCVECGLNFQVIKGKCVPIVVKCKDNEVLNKGTNKCDCKTGFTRGADGVCRLRCAAGQVEKNGACVSQCKQNQVFNVKNGNCDCIPDFTRDATGVCRSRCPGNERWNGKICICPKGFARYGTCRQCPIGSLPNADGTKCVCTGNQIFSADRFACVACPTNSKPKTDLTECVCNTGYVKSGAACILSCGRNEQPNQTTGKCDCVYGYYRADKKNCVPRCKANEEWNGSKCICRAGFSVFKGTCTKCPDSVTNQDRTKCLCNAPNFIFNPSTWKCQACQANAQNSDDDTKCICKPGFNAKGNSCVPGCQLNEQFNPKSGQCECAYGFLKLGPICVERCGLNQEWNGKECLCKENHVSVSGVCKPCPNGLKTNPSRKACVCGDAKQFWNLNSFACQVCPSNSSPNGDFTDFVCFPGYTKNGFTCVANCPAEAAPDASGRCICSGGKVLQGNQCIQPISCPARSSWNSNTLECVCNTKGEFLLDGQCKACGENSFYSANEKKCVCNTGFFRIGGVCTVCDPRTRYNGTDCECNLGFFGNRNKCEKCHASCSKCTGPEANQCQSCSDVSLILQKGFCSKNTPCDPGFFLDKTCQKCTDNCLICDNIFECQQCALGYQVQTLDVSGQKIQACTEICGDGIKYEAECDDGNTVNGDGCSNQCTVEEGWNCEGGSSAQKSRCKKFIPDQTVLVSRGTVNLGDRVILGLRCDFLPTCLTKNECSNCFKMLKVNVVNANVPILVKTNFIPFSQYQFAIEYNFQGLIVTSKFKTVIKLNEEFKGCLADDDFDQQLELEIDPAFLALVDTEQTLTLDDLDADPNKIKIPKEASALLWTGS